MSKRFRNHFYDVRKDSRAVTKTRWYVVSGISSEFKSPYNKPFIVTMKKGSFPRSDRVQTIARNKTREWSCCEIACKIEGIISSRSEKFRELATRENGTAEWRTILIQRCALFELESVLRGNYSRQRLRMRSYCGANDEAR